MRIRFLATFALGALLTGTALAAPPDAGPGADVAAVKAAQRLKDPGDGIGGVHVVGNYALVQWYGNPEGSGPAGFKRISGEHWASLFHDGGAITVDQLAQRGIPAAIARRLCSGWPNGTSPCVGFN